MAVIYEALSHASIMSCQLSYNTQSYCLSSDILSDPLSRQLYNQFGPDGMKQHQGAQAGQGNARDAWDEFKPFTKENKRTKARAASQASTSVDGDLDATSSDEG